MFASCLPRRPVLAGSLCSPRRVTDPKESRSRSTSGPAGLPSTPAGRGQWRRGYDASLGHGHESGLGSQPRFLKPAPTPPTSFTSSSALGQLYTPHALARRLVRFSGEIAATNLAY